jgi:hypothetical protein
MTDEQIMNHYEVLKRIFGSSLPNPEHQPAVFAYHVKLYRYFHQQEYDKINEAKP